MAKSTPLDARWSADAIAAAFAFIRGATARSPFGATPAGLTDLRGLPVAEFYRPEGATLDGVDFSGLRARSRVIFTESELHNCLFNHSEMRWGDHRSRFENVSFAEAQIAQSGFGSEGSKYVHCDFSRCNARGSIGLSPVFESCCFDDAVLDRTVFNGCTCLRCRFAGAIQDVMFGTRGQVTMSECDLRSARLVNTDFKRTTFDACDLSNRAAVFLDWPQVLDRFDRITLEVEPLEFRKICHRWSGVWRQLVNWMPQNLIDLDNLIYQIGETWGPRMFAIFLEIQALKLG